MSKVSIDDLETAREWLLINEGEEGEGESCRRVADWIKIEILDREIRSAARKAGVSVAFAKARRALPSAESQDR